jgi:hypothetical protein
MSGDSERSAKPLLAAGRARTRRGPTNKVYGCRSQSPYAIIFRKDVVLLYTYSLGNCIIPASPFTGSMTSSGAKIGSRDEGCPGRLCFSFWQ